MLIHTTVVASIAAMLMLPICASAADVTVAANGRSDYTIVIPDEQSVAVNYAASELQSFIEQATGAKLQISRESHAIYGPAFLVGPSKRAQKTGLVAQVKTLTGDGVLIKTVGKDIVLLGGNDRGQLYSVYCFLEKYLGVRFLAYDCTVVPKHETLKLAKIDYSYSPPFIYREELYYHTHKWEFAARQKLNGGNMNQVLSRPWPGKDELIPGIVIAPFAHSISAIIPSSKYHAEHPEYFGLVNGVRRGGTIGTQACFTNPDVERITKEYILNFIEKHPTVASVDVSQMDAYPGDYGACECENCKAVEKEEGAQMGPILRLVNSVADVVKEKYPDKFVDTLAYQYTIIPPKITKPRDNVIIRLCHWGCYFHGIEGEDLSKDYRAAIDGWREAGASHIWVWHYSVNFWNYLAPNPNLEAMVKDIRYYAKHGVDGLMVQGDLQSPGGELCEFRGYLSAQLMWDPNQDPMQIRKDFCEGYYGPAAGEAMEFLAFMDKWGRETTQHIPMNGWHTKEFTKPEIVKSAMAILDRAYDKAGDPVYRFHVEKLMIPFWFIQLNWPDDYGVSQDQCAATWARFRRVIEQEKITDSAEGGSIKGFVAAMDAKYPAGK